MRQILPGLSLLALIWGAAGLTAAQQDQPEFGLASFEISPPETGRLSCMNLKFGEQHFSLVRPRQWRAEPSSSGVRFRNKGDNATILITLMRIPLTQTNLDVEGPVRTELGARDFTPLLQFDQPTSIGSGRAFDFAWEIQGSRMKGRSVMVRAGKTVVSFLLMCPHDSFNTRQQEFGALLGSFQNTPTPVRKN